MSSNPARSPGEREGRFLLLIAALAGAGTMVVELAAVRLLAPWFGTSLVVWTNVIGVILLALALGYRLGGKLAARPAPLRVMGWLLVAAGCWVCWLPHLGAALARWILPEHIGLHEAAELVGWGSLAVSMLVFLPPAVLLGTVCPLAVESLARVQKVSPGRAGGSVLFSSTLGSLVGVFGTSHLFLPELGSKGTFLLAGGGLLCAGCAALLARRGTRGSLVGILALVGVGAPGLVPLPQESEGSEIHELARSESRYQSLRVVEDRSRKPAIRFLRSNEGFDSFQSVWQPEPGLLEDGFYYNDFLLPLAWSRATGPWNVLVLGLGAGTVLRVFSGEPGLDTHFTGVELDPEVIELGRQWMELTIDNDGSRIWPGLDARVALRIVDRQFEQIVLDCYANQVEIPPHLCTFEFFQELRARLSAGGWLTANLGGFDFDDPVVDAVARTCARAFGAAVLLIKVPSSRNFMLMARRDGRLPWDGRGLEPAATSRRLSLGPRRLPGFSALVEASGSSAILTDDCCPIEQLQFRSIREASRRRLHLFAP
ncbi:MAG: hypothetical protein EXS08_05405 [Planctomycetes bacterium]|nr:hypothetical protein [Planctomycetota bacterium]